MTFKWIYAVLASLALAACSTPAMHPSLHAADDTTNALPALVPVRNYVADWDSNGLYQISPDGTQLNLNSSVTP